MNKTAVIIALLQFAAGIEAMVGGNWKQATVFILYSLTTVVIGGMK